MSSANSGKSEPTLSVNLSQGNSFMLFLLKQSITKISISKNLTKKTILGTLFDIRTKELF